MVPAKFPAGGFFYKTATEIFLHPQVISPNCANEHTLQLCLHSLLHQHGCWLILTKLRMLRGKGWPSQMIRAATKRSQNNSCSQRLHSQTLPQVGFFFFFF